MNDIKQGNGIRKTFRKIKKLAENMNMTEAMEKAERVSDNGNGSRYRETATNFFSDLSAAYRLAPDYKRMYEHFNRILTTLLFQSTDFLRVRFSGTFARMNYLLEECGASREQCALVNNMRVHLRGRAVMTPEEQSREWRYDFKALAVFVGIVCKTDVPQELQKLFPPPRASEHRGILLSEVQRIIIDSWDDEYVYGRQENGGSDTLKVCYAHGNTNYNYDWTYLRDYFHKGAQLNLVRPRLEGGSVYPELIIFEPDILVDVSAVARCFNDYGTSPLFCLLDKISLKAESKAILLGNLASRFLDEEVNNTPEQNSFNASVRNFYASNPLEMITTGIADEPQAFYSEARMQKQNIREAVRSSLPNIVGKFSPKEIMLEPSFISEMLGLQGRMDFLQLDQYVVIEQKSGKCGFPQRDADTPVLKESHYVQVLLYMLILRYNYRAQYEHNGHAQQAFLLYSKYRNSLLGVGFAPELVFKAIKMRNAIAWNELMAARGGFRILDTLTPEDFLSDGDGSRFFEQYIKPSIESTLSPLHTARPLDKAYFYRFMRFVQIEHLLSKTGSQTKPGTGFASTWHNSLEDKHQLGSIYDRLSIEKLYGDNGKVEFVTLRLDANTDNGMSDFRPGDIVILYPYAEGTEPDARRTIIFRCTVASITAENITLKLRAPQSDPNVFKFHNYYRWAVEHDFMESSYSSLYRGMYSFLSAPQNRRDLILLQREPETDTSVTLKGEYGEFNELMLRVRQARDIFLILGPPGTGKTSYGLLNTLKEALLEPSASVLLLSYTNRAVDEICSKLSVSGIDFIRFGSELSCAAEYREYLLCQKVKNYPRLADFERKLVGTRVYVGTTSSVGAHMSIFSIKQFDLAVIDEASQILEPHLMGLMCATHNGECAIRKFVFIGDHKQLPAVVQQNRSESVVREPELRAISLTDCRKSLFQRFYNVYGNDSRFTYMLTKQGRMHHDIAAFPNFAFYGNTLREVPLEHQTRQLLPVCSNGNNGIDDILTTRRIAFIAAPSQEETVSDKVNQTEADIIAAIVHRIYMLHKETFIPTETIGVIVPYRNQISTIRNTIECRYKTEALRDITIDTVERYQGSQRDYVIYGFTISRYYQLNFLTDTNFTDTYGAEIDCKLNVAMTRAREGLFIVGNPQLLRRNSIYSKLIDFIKSKQGFFDIEPQKFIEGDFTVPAVDAARRV